MSIATKTGDAGETALIYGRRVPKTYRRVEAYGTVDELNSALGLARANLGDRMDYRKVAATLLSAKGSEQVPGLSRFTRGGNRLQLAKFLNELKSL